MAWYDELAEAVGLAPEEKAAVAAEARPQRISGLIDTWGEVGLVLGRLGPRLSTAAAPIVAAWAEDAYTAPLSGGPLSALDMEATARELASQLDKAGATPDDVRRTVEVLRAAAADLAAAEERTLSPWEWVKEYGQLVTEDAGKKLEAATPKIGAAAIGLLLLLGLAVAGRR